MTMMDTLDGIFMNVAYGWAFFNPVRKVFYNLAITGLSVAICFFIGSIELLGLLPMELKLKGHFWKDMSGFNINTAGFIIVGMFLLTWLGAIVIWRVGNIEEKWGSRLKRIESPFPDAASPDGDGDGGTDVAELPHRIDGSRLPHIDVDEPVPADVD
jgi:nickel/cobalt transporter (NiCoT) family protein